MNHRMNSNARLPKICVVTPSFNQGPFLEQTILSVLEQNYPHLEYIIMDGGSTDESVEIIKKYQRHLAFWQSKPDKGQSDAIRQGFARSSAEVMAWLNSDDYYEPSALQLVGESFTAMPDKVLCYGDYYVQGPAGDKQLKKKVSFDFNICLYAYLMIPQPASFWKRSAYDAVDGLDLQLHYAMDWDFFLRVGKAFPGRMHHLHQPLATFRLHEVSKSVSAIGRFKQEHQLIRNKFGHEPRWRRRLKRYFQLVRLELKFLTERGTLPLRKDRRKA